MTLVNGTATVNLGKFAKQGKKLLTIQYLGNVGLDCQPDRDFQGQEDDAREG